MRPRIQRGGAVGLEHMRRPATSVQVRSPILDNPAAIMFRDGDDGRLKRQRRAEQAVAHLPRQLAAQPRVVILSDQHQACARVTPDHGHSIAGFPHILARRTGKSARMGLQSFKDFAKKAKDGSIHLSVLTRVIGQDSCATASFADNARRPTYLHQSDRP